MRHPYPLKNPSRLNSACLALVITNINMGYAQRRCLKHNLTFVRIKRNNYLLARNVKNVNFFPNNNKEIYSKKYDIGAHFSCRNVYNIIFSFFTKQNSLFWMKNKKQTVIPYYRHAEKQKRTKNKIILKRQYRFSYWYLFISIKLFS